MIVADASVGVLALLNDGPARGLLADEVVAAPHLIDVEIAHALRRRAQHGTLEPEQAQEALRRWSVLGVRRFAATGLLARVWSLRENLTAHDATYVALAEALDCALETADTRLAGAPGPNCAVTVIRR